MNPFKWLVSSGTKNRATDEVDRLVRKSFCQLAADPHVLKWSAKEHDWVSYFAFRFLLAECREDGPLKNPAQIGIEVCVPQPPGYPKPTVCRDLIIWADVGTTCWDRNWTPCQHPLAIIEWKVHRPGRRNRDVQTEREWLRRYCEWQPHVLGYAIEIDGTKSHTSLTCARYLGIDIDTNWLSLKCG